MISAADRTRHAQAVAEIFDLMGKYGLTLDDLIQIGGADLKSPNPKRAEKARRVSKCWESMARLSVNFADLEARGEGHFSEVIETKGVSATSTSTTESNEINDLADSGPVGGPDPNSANTAGAAK